MMRDHRSPTANSLSRCVCTSSRTLGSSPTPHAVMYASRYARQRALPVELAVVVDGELRGAGVVRAVEHVGRDGDLGPRERGDDAIVIGEVEDAADVEQHGFGCRHRANVAGSVPA